MGDGNVLFVRSDKINDDELPENEDDIWDDTALIEAYDQAVNLAKEEVEQRMNGSFYDQNLSSSDCSLPVKNKFPQKTKKKTKKWSLGENCRCIYSEDGLTYEGNVVKINQNGSCIVRYLGYNNEEEVLIKILQPSHGKAAREQQIIESTESCDPKPSSSQKLHEHIKSENTSKHNKNRLLRSPHNKMDWETQASHRGQSRASSSHGSEFRSPPWINHQPNVNSAPHMMFPPPPPPNLLAVGCPEDESDALSSMLMSWYMSGFHTGYYQGMKNGSSEAKRHYQRTPMKRK